MSRPTSKKTSCGFVPGNLWGQRWLNSSTSSCPMWRTCPACSATRTKTVSFSIHTTARQPSFLPSRHFHSSVRSSSCMACLFPRFSIHWAGAACLLACKVYRSLCCFTATETVRTIRDGGSPGRLPRLSHSLLPELRYSSSMLLCVHRDRTDCQGQGEPRTSSLTSMQLLSSESGWVRSVLPLYVHRDRTGAKDAATSTFTQVLTQTPSTGLRHPSFDRCRKAMLGVWSWPLTAACTDLQSSIFMWIACPTHGVQWS